MYANKHPNASSLRYFLLVFAISVPFWLLGLIFSDALGQVIPINLPISALMVFCPLIAAAFFVYKQNGSAGVKKLLSRIFDYHKITDKRWYIGIIALMPFIMLLSYILMRLTSRPLPNPQIPFLMIPLFFLLFFITAIGEEVGWQGYVFDPLQDRWGTLKAGLVLGIVWALWHVIPFIQTGNTPSWILWQSLNLVVLRILIVWIYNNTGKSVFGAIVFHTMINVSVFLFPNYGSHYDPFVTFVITSIVALIVVSVWRPRTFTQYRYRAS